MSGAGALPVTNCVTLSDNGCSVSVAVVFRAPRWVSATVHGAELYTDYVSDDPFVDRTGPSCDDVRRGDGVGEWCPPVT